MKKKTIKIILSSFLFFFLLVLANRVFGQGLENIYPESGGFKPEAVDVPLPQFVKYIFTFSFIAAGVIAFGSLILAGGRYAFSAGKPEAKKELKKHFLSIFGGIIILLFSYLILTTINPQLTVLRLPALEEIPAPVLTESKIPEALEPDPLERIKNVAKAASILSGQIKQEASNLKNQLSLCDCGAGQSMCLCQGKGGAETTEKAPELEYYYRSQGIGVQPFDVPLSFKTNPDLLNKADLQLSAQSQVYLESKAFAPDFPLDLNREIDIAKNSFNSVYQDSLNQNRVFVLGNEHFQEVIDENVDKIAAKYGVSAEQSQIMKRYYGEQAIASTMPDGEIIINGNRITIEENPLGVIGTMTHEYVHVVDSVTEGGQRVFSSSPEYLKIYGDASLYYRSQELMGRKIPDDPFKATYGFASNYGRLGPNEDFAETVRTYIDSDGDPTKITNDPTTQELIQKRFNFIKERRIVK